MGEMYISSLDTITEEQLLGDLYMTFSFFFNDGYDVDGPHW